MTEIILKDIFKSYDQTEVIHGVDLKVESGKFLVLVGPSGCGKSTLLRIIAGLERITSGEILIDGNEVSNIPASERGLAMVFQSYALYPHMTVFDNMAFGLKIEKKSKEEITERVMEAAKILQIEEYLERKPKQLSGGQRQRVAIGRAITRKPKVFLFDEPLSNLDAALRVQMRVELAKLHDQLNATMIYVTHDQTEAMTLADDIVVLDQGIVSQKGSPLKLYNEPENLIVGGFIGSPKMNFINTKVISSNSSSTEVEISGQGKIIVPKTSDKVSPGDSVKIGIRPEHILINTAEKCWESKVFVIEKLGSSTFLYLEKEGEPLVVQTDGASKVNVGDNLSLSFDLNKCHLFDSNNLAFK